MKIYGVVLAGGQSSRMGQDKALLSLQGQTLLQRQLQTLAQILPPENVWVSGCREAYKPYTDRLIADLFKQRGPLAGILSAIEFFLKYEDESSYGVFVVPVDMPLLTSASLQILLDATKAYQALSRPDAICFSHHQLPLLILNPLKILEVIYGIFELRDSSKCSIRKLLSHINTHTLPQLNSDELKNTNTPQQWSEVLNHEY